MLHYLIDGYNLLFALPQMPPGTWVEKRLGLLMWLTQTRPQGRNQATIVFDNRQGWGNQDHYNDITLVYTSGETADDWIIRKTRETKNPRVLVIVSNDKGIQRMIRGTGARWMGADAFIQTTTRNAPSAPDDETSSENMTITDELRRRWLGD